MSQEQLLWTMARDEGYIKALDYYDKRNLESLIRSRSLVNLERSFRRQAEREKANPLG